MERENLQLRNREKIQSKVMRRAEVEKETMESVGGNDTEEKKVAELETGTL